jgi:hypothetical protein
MPSLEGAKDSFIVAVVEAARDRVLTVPAAGRGLLVSWEFFLEPIAPRTTTQADAEGPSLLHNACCFSVSVPHRGASSEGWRVQGVQAPRGKSQSPLA